MPECPTCKYPILGFQKLNINLAVQAIVSRHLEYESKEQGTIGDLRKGSEAISHTAEDLATEGDFVNLNLKNRPQDEIEILMKDPNLSTIKFSTNEVKCIGFSLVQSEPFRPFVGTSYEFEIDYHLSDELFKLLIPDHYFIGFDADKKKDIIEHQDQATGTYSLDFGALFLIEKIVKFTISSVKVVARCKSHLIDLKASILDFSNHVFVKKMVNDCNDGAYLNYLAGKELKLVQPTEIAPYFVRKLISIESKMCNFINTLKDTNEIIAEHFIQRYGADSYGRKFSIDWKVDVHGFLNAVCSMLNMPTDSKRIISEHYNYEFRIEQVDNFLSSASFESDPIFFLNYENRNYLNHFYTHIGFILALALFIVSVFYPKYSFWEFK